MKLTSPCGGGCSLWSTMCSRWGRKEQDDRLLRRARAMSKRCWHRCAPPSSLVPNRRCALAAAPCADERQTDWSRGRVASAMAQSRGNCPGSCAVRTGTGAVLQRAMPRFKAVAKHQAVERDLAIVVAERLTRSDHGCGGSAVPASLLRSAVLFDVYRPRRPARGKSPPQVALWLPEKRVWRCA